MKKLIYSLIVTLLVGGSFAQSQSNVLDGAWIKAESPTRRIIPYIHLRQSDIMFSKRVWRIMDLREKINLPLYYPLEKINDRMSLYQVIKENILVTGELTAYNAWFEGTQEDDEFRSKMSLNEVKEVMSRIEEYNDYSDPDDPDYFEVKYDTVPINNEEIVQFKIKEDWFLDKKRSVMDVRIIGLAPMKPIVKEGVLLGFQEMFWLYFPYCRHVFGHQVVFNRQNDEQRLTLDDVFHKRQFSSYIVKESNVYDRKIEDHKKGLDALLESEKIRDYLFKMEHDLWEF